MINQELPSYYKFTIKLLFLILSVFILIWAKDLLLPLTISMFFTFLLFPISKKLMQWKIPEALAILISIIMAMAVFGGLIYFFYYQILSFSDDLPELQKSLDDKMLRLQNFINKNFNISNRDQSKWLDEKVKETAGSGDEYLMGFFSATTSFMASLALIPIYIFFLTYYKEKYKKFIVIVSRDENSENVLNILKKVSTVSQKYLKGLLLDILILSVLNSIGFLFLGLKHAILFGVLAAILNIIPYIGVLIGSILPVTMAFITKDEIGYAIGAAAVCVFVQFLDNNFITPWVVGSSVSINPLTATIVLITSAMIWGVAGMILCMPLTGMLKVVFDNIDSLKPYGYLIGEEVNYRQKEHIHDAIMKRFRIKKK